jgi:NAD dependent epimerase/dehydratase
MQSEHVLVTGAAGFIGSHLIELLVREGFRVRAFVHYNSSRYWPNLEQIPADTRREIEIVAGDVADARSVSGAVTDCDWVFHLAALIGIPYSYSAPASYVQTNVTGTLNVLDACRDHSVKRLIHTSTSETYGSAQYVPIDEKHPSVGQSPYSATKIGADKLAESYWLSFGTPVTTVRPFNTYGPRQSQRAVIPTIITQALAGHPLKLGNLDPVRDLTFVTDTAAGFLAAARSEKLLGEVVNLGVGDGYSVRELVDKVGQLLGRSLEVEMEEERVRPPGSEVVRLISDNEKALSLMDWRPKVTLETGLAATIEHIRDHPEAYSGSGYVV